MIRANLLILRKKRSVTGWAFVLTAGVMLAFYVYSAIARAADPAHHAAAGGLEHFQNAFTTLGLDFGTVAAILIRVEAGAGEAADGVFKELVVTGRSRLALFAARIPAAVIVTLAVFAAAMTISIVATFACAGGQPTPDAWLVLRSVGWVALSNTVVCVVAVGLGALIGSRPAALISFIAWQTIASRLLMDTSSLGAARHAVLDASLTKLMPGPHKGDAIVMTSITAILIIASWVIAAVVLGARRTVTRDA
jgi:hypothetical protein